MLEGSQTGEQEGPRERARTSTDEGATRLRMMQAGHASGHRNSKLEKNR
ncbi:MAG: hypothetical protein M3426_17870 [Actinomycetota bacterium]|nr:hypothetical protein [Actinomycetota bacterium]